MESMRPYRGEIDTQGILEAQNKVLTVALALAESTQDPKAAKGILEVGQQLYFGLGTILRPRTDGIEVILPANKRRGALQLIRDLRDGVQRTLIDGSRIMNNWE